MTIAIGLTKHSGKDTFVVAQWWIQPPLSHVQATEAAAENSELVQDSCCSSLEAKVLGKKLTSR